MGVLLVAFAMGVLPRLKRYQVADVEHVAAVRNRV
jgi:hypothetical protein